MDRGRIGILARSCALARDVGEQLPKFGLGVSRLVSAPGPGVTHLDALKMFQSHWGTDGVVLLGAIDDVEEPACTEWLGRHMDKPVIGFIDDADPSRAQTERLRACGVHMSRDAAGIAALTASLVELPWLPFD